MSEDKYLPIGTVCTIRNAQKPVMITGYFSLEYNGNVKMYDYQGCDYPEGLLLSNKNYSFNHADIIHVDYMGYQNEEYAKLNTNMNRQLSEKNADDYHTEPVFSNIQFDQNGVVIYDPISLPERKTPLFTSQNTSVKESEVDNPFTVKYQEKKETPENDTRNWSIFKDIKFDENGVVVSAEEYTAQELEN